MKRKYNSSTVLRSKTDETCTVTIGQLISHVQMNEKIMSIKLWRQFTGQGLKDSKDKIESCVVVKVPISNSAFGAAWENETVDNVIDAFMEVSYFPKLTKEEFLNMVSNAVDNMDKFHCTDMMEAVEFLFKGIRAKGGLQKIAEENDKFIDGI